MNWFYNVIGKIFFNRQKNWERQKNAKTMTWVVVFSVVLALSLSELIKIMYNHAK